MTNECLLSPRCHACLYYTAQDGACNYLLMTGRRRVTPVARCRKNRYGCREGSALRSLRFAREGW